MQNDTSDWEFADAWVLTAVAISQRPCSLTDLVAAADLINHALLLDAEVDSALRKLLGSGLLHVTADLRFDLTPEGTALVDGRNGSLFTQIDSVLSLLDAVRPRDREFALPSGAMRAAVDAYRARSHKR